ncbi:MAG: acyl-CoA thioesterase [Planctomycetes bacterium]|nr:acyl-CoA thioesterase [Planctomycetota bacterium]
MAGQIFTTTDGRAIAFDDPDPYFMEHTVEPGDIDGQGHVNNAVYVSWMDRAAFAHSRAVGYDMEAYRRAGASFVVRRHEIEYFAPAFEGERIVVATWPCRMERFTALRRHHIVRVADGATLVKALTRWIYIDTATGRPRRMPDELIKAFSPRDTE